MQPRASQLRHSLHITASQFQLITQDMSQGTAKEPAFTMFSRHAGRRPPVRGCRIVIRMWLIAENSYSAFCTLVFSRRRSRQYPRLTTQREAAFSHSNATKLRQVTLRRPCETFNGNQRSASRFFIDLRQLVRPAPRSTLAFGSLAPLSHQRSVRSAVALCVSRQMFDAPTQAIAHNMACAAKRSDKQDRRL